MNLQRYDMSLRYKDSMMKKIAFAIMGSMMMLSGCQTWSLGQKKPKADIVYSDLQRCDAPVQMKVGQIFRFNATENASTGYYWSLIKSNDALLSVQQFYQANRSTGEKQAVGGTKSFLFTALKAGEIDIILHHGQGWGSYSGTPWQCKLQIVDAI